MLYGRNSQKEVSGSKIVFQNFSEVHASINYEVNENVHIKMKKVFNVVTNCIPSPNVLHMPHKAQKLQFGI